MPTVQRYTPQRTPAQRKMALRNASSVQSAQIMGNEFLPNIPRNNIRYSLTRPQPTLRDFNHAETVKNVGGAVLNRLAVYKAEQDATAVREALLTAKGSLRDMYARDASLKGKDAEGMYDRAEEETRALKESLLGKLKNKEQQNLFNERIDGAISPYLDKYAQNQAVQNEVRRQQVIDGTVQAAREAISIDPSFQSVYRELAAVREAFADTHPAGEEADPDAKDAVPINDARFQKEGAKLVSEAIDNMATKAPEQLGVLVKKLQETVPWLVDPVQVRAGLAKANQSYQKNTLWQGLLSMEELKTDGQLDYDKILSFVDSNPEALQQYDHDIVQEIRGDIQAAANTAAKRKDKILKEVREHQSSLLLDLVMNGTEQASQIGLRLLKDKKRNKLSAEQTERFFNTFTKVRVYKDHQPTVDKTYLEFVTGKIDATEVRSRVGHGLTTEKAQWIINLDKEEKDRVKGMTYYLTTASMNLKSRYAGNSDKIQLYEGPLRTFLLEALRADEDKKLDGMALIEMANKWMITQDKWGPDPPSQLEAATKDRMAGDMSAYPDKYPGGTDPVTRIPDKLAGGEKGSGAVAEQKMLKYFSDHDIVDTEFARKRYMDWMNGQRIKKIHDVPDDTRTVDPYGQLIDNWRKRGRSSR